MQVFKYFKSRPNISTHQKKKKKKEKQLRYLCITCKYVYITIRRHFFQAKSSYIYMYFVLFQMHKV